VQNRKIQKCSKWAIYYIIYKLTCFHFIIFFFSPVGCLETDRSDFAQNWVILFLKKNEETQIFCFEKVIVLREFFKKPAFFDPSSVKWTFFHREKTKNFEILYSSSKRVPGGS
jgi:hypothetical protein